MILIYVLGTCSPSLKGCEECDYDLCDICHQACDNDHVLEHDVDDRNLSHGLPVRAIRLDSELDRLSFAHYGSLWCKVICPGIRVHLTFLSMIDFEKKSAVELASI